MPSFRGYIFLLRTALNAVNLPGCRGYYTCYYPYPLRRAEGSAGLPVILVFLGQIVAQNQVGRDAAELLRLAWA
jgi:hypothetical protein